MQSSKEILSKIKEESKREENIINPIKGNLENNKKLLESILKNSKQIPKSGDKKKDEELLKDFADYVSSNDELMNALDDYRDNYNQVVQEQMKELDDILKDRDIESVVETLKSYKKRYEEKGNENQVRECNALIAEIENSFKLDNIYESIDLIKDPKKFISSYNSNYEKEFKSFKKKLRRNKKYMFTSIDNLLEDVTALIGSEDDAKVFLYQFFKYFASEKRVEKNAVFINEFTKNIHKKIRDNNDIKDRINEIVTKIRNL